MQGKNKGEKYPILREIIFGQTSARQEATNHPSYHEK